jgi:hypothetical protein
LSPKNFTFALLQAGLSLQLTVGEESPDSTERCTGEEPGTSISAERYIGVTESATENNFFSAEVAPGGNSGRLPLRVKVKTWG